MLRHLPLALILALASSLGGCSCNSTPLGQKAQPQPLCSAPKQLNAVGDCVDCVDNADCTATQVCNLLSGKCEPIPTPPDAGPGNLECGIGAIRCAPDGHAVQECEAADGGTGWVDQTECTGGEICNPMTLTCAICVPGETICDRDAGPAAYRSCAADGTGFTLLSCDDADAGTIGFSCEQVVPSFNPTDGGAPQAGLTSCQLCNPLSSACVAVADGGVGLNICDSTGGVLEYSPCYPTNNCIVDGGLPPYCEPYVCFPGQANCEFDDGGTPSPYTNPARQTCNANGTGWVDAPCTNPLVCGPQGTQEGACLTACQVVENSSSYFGCDYWGAVLSNSALASAFLVSDAGSPGEQPSDFAFVVSNTNPTQTANVTVATAGLPNVTASVPPNSVVPVYLPWRAICGTGLAQFAFHLTSDIPVTVYQFNPLHSFLGSGFNQTFSYTNDASLLLPTHLLGTSYVVASYNQISEGQFGNASDGPLAGEFNVIATQDDTHINIQFAGAAASTARFSQGFGAICSSTEGNLPSQASQTLQPFTLNQGQVLQFWADNVGVPTCQTSLNGDLVCVYPNDFTGTVITSVSGPGVGPDGGAGGTAPKPIAVFGGADCTYVPFNQIACDHIEEEMFPFNTWGKEYVGVKTAAYSGATVAYPDFFRLISACGPNSCPNGATATFTPAVSITEGQNWCNSTGGTTVCTLPPLGPNQTAPWIALQTGASFHVISDQPVALAQYLVSESEAGWDSNTLSATASEGDPDLLLAPPVEQWRTTYTVLAPNTYLDNYLDMVVEQNAANPNATESVLVDGAPIAASEWNNIPNTDFYVANHHVCGRTDSVCSGSHTISSAQPVGVQISGYDSYVSYSYTGGLDLQSITLIQPGG